MNNSSLSHTACNDVALSRENQHMSDIMVTQEPLHAVFSGVPLPQEPVESGFAVGVFDLFHLGHLRYLQQARRYCRHLRVAVSPDPLVEQYKHQRTLLNFSERCELLQGFNWIDQVIAQAHSLESTADIVNWLTDLTINHAFIGQDWQGSARWDRLGPALAERGIAVSFIARTSDISTSQLRQRILSR